MWTNEIAIDPSPTADATRLTLPPRISPTAKTPGKLVSLEQSNNKELIKSFIEEVFNKHNLEVIDKYHAACWELTEHGLMILPSDGLAVLLKEKVLSIMRKKSTLTVGVFR